MACIISSMLLDMQGAREESSDCVKRLFSTNFSCAAMKYTMVSLDDTHYSKHVIAYASKAGHDGRKQ